MILYSTVKKRCCPLLLVLGCRIQARSPMIKVLMKEKKRPSQKLIMLKKFDHLLPPSKTRMKKLTHQLPPLKIRMTQLKKQRNQGLLQCLIDLMKLRDYKKYQTLRSNYYQRQFICLCFDWIRIKFSKCYTRAKHIPSKNKSKKTADVLILIKKPIREKCQSQKNISRGFSNAYIKRKSTQNFLTIST